MKLHLNLATADLAASIAFYSVLLADVPVKRLDDYALFVTADPGLELALDLDPAAAPGSGQHYGLVVSSADAVEAQAARLQDAGYAIDLEREETCCYAVQTKVWASDPDGRRWETYVVHEEADDRDGESCCADEAESAA